MVSTVVPHTTWASYSQLWQFEDYLCGIRRQIDVTPCQVRRAPDLAPFLTGGKGLQFSLGELQRTVRHADTSKLAHHISGAWGS